jgi:sugar phosphate isomerase/epimerase
MPRVSTPLVEAELVARAARRNRVSISQLTLDPVATLPFVDAAAGAGFRSLGLRLAAAPGANAPHTPMSPTDVVALKRRLVDLDVTADLATGFWLLPEAEPHDFAATLDLAAAIGVRCVLAVCNDPDEIRALDRFSATCGLAAERDLDVGLEFMAYTALKSIAAAAAFIDRADVPNAGLIVDALHLARSGGTPADVARLDPRSIALVQLCDAPLAAPAANALRMEARTGRLYPGDGELWLDELMDALPANVWIDIEAPSATPGTPEEKARRAADATNRFLESHRPRSRAAR